MGVLPVTGTPKEVVDKCVLCKRITFIRPLVIQGHGHGMMCAGCRFKTRKELRMGR